MRLTEFLAKPAGGWWSVIDTVKHEVAYPSAERELTLEQAELMKTLKTARAGALS